ncbi:MAG TPA: N-acetylneuraminate synthase family protein [Vicinamibacterales bacterium]|jgi:sialic acid synthase SpsE|nr:N-acetylneuraminate synthase family protein [Vicinamibacterales bacterium]|tara:strand:+ start:6595 stop:7641 length:1047 start_codon:yes stop_codon:yes gene_type:complete
MSSALTCEIAPGRKIGDGRPCFVIAEIGSNHNQDFDLAKKTIDAAAEAGVDAVKFQTFRAETHYSIHAPSVSSSGSLSTFELVKSLELDRSWHAPLKKYCESLNLIFLSSACDIEAIDELDELEIAALKVPSCELSDLGLIRHMAQTGRPLILSTGLADWMDIQRAVDTCRDVGNRNLVLLQCTSLYPAPPHLSNLEAIKVMRDAFGVLTGYSDHTAGDHVCLASVALGACVVEKHLTLDRKLVGPDHPFSMEPTQFKEMMQRLRDVEAALGDGTKTGPRSEEREVFEQGRRSLHAKIRIPKGAVIKREMITAKRPGLGIPPYLMDLIIGRVARSDIEADQWITWTMI